MPKSATHSSLYRRLLSYAFRYKAFFAISIFGFAIYAAAQSSLVFATELFVNLLEGKPTQWLRYLPEALVNSVLLLPVVVVTLTLLRGVGYFLGYFFISRVGLLVVNTLRKEVFTRLVYAPQPMFDKSSSGEYISLVIYNIEQVTGSVTNAVKILFEDGFFLIGLLTVLFFLNWKLTLVFFAATPITIGLVFFASRYFRRVSRKIQKSVGVLSQVTSESIQNISTVKSYAAENLERDRFIQAADSNLQFSQKFERVKAMQAPILHSVIGVSLAVIFLLVILFWQEGDAGAAVAFITAAGLIGKPIKQLSTINSVIQRGLAAAETIFGVIDTAPEKNDGRITLNKVEGRIDIRALSFEYEKDRPVLNNIDLEIAAEKTVAFVGPSGCGKTTLANLILRLYTVERGTLLIDGQDINDITLESLRDNIGIVGQNAVVFDSSVIDNVCYGANSADTERVISALKLANAYDFVMALPDGLNTRLGEAGNLLSGGQKQRIAIARALYKDAPILILDEATSALDNTSERLIQEALENLSQNRTTIIIAHRLSTIQKADSIVVFDKGRIIEQGKHEQLLQENGAYAQLLKNQSEH